MTSRRAGFIIATVFFFAWLGILYAGADHPPPAGFLYLVLLDLVAAAAVFWRVPDYVGSYKLRRQHRKLQVSMEGLVAGLLAAVLMLLAPSGGEPSIQVTTTAYVIWFAVLGVIGAANAILVCTSAAYLLRKSGQFDNV